MPKYEQYQINQSSAFRCTGFIDRAGQTSIVIDRSDNSLVRTHGIIVTEYNEICFYEEPAAKPILEKNCDCCDKIMSKTELYPVELTTGFKKGDYHTTPKPIIQYLWLCRACYFQNDIFEF